MKKISVLTSLSQFGSIGIMKFDPTYTRHICYLRSPKFWQLIGEYVPKMATYVSFAVLYICIHILNTPLNAGLEGRHCLLVSAFIPRLSLSSQSVVSTVTVLVFTGEIGIEIQEMQFRNPNS